MLPPHRRSIPELAKEEDISEATLYIWRKAARADGRLLPDDLAVGHVYHGLPGGAKACSRSP
jgi:transposase-like protein